MEIYDISQEVFSSVVYEGDPSPKRITEKSMDKGAVYNLSSFFMGAHNGTHVDAPLHFFSDGKDVSMLSLNSLIGEAVVLEANGEIGKEEALTILERARSISFEGSKRMLLKGDVAVNVYGAKELAKGGVLLLGVEAQSCSKPTETMAVHKELLSKDVALLEGIRLDKILEGGYLLNAVPLNLKGLEGAPCRAILIKG